MSARLLISKRPLPVVVLSAFVGLAGLLNILQALQPQTDWTPEQLENWTPFHIAVGSQMLLLLAGIWQLSLGRGLWRRKKGAWIAAVTVFVAGVALSIGRDFQWGYALGHLMVLGLLWHYRRVFRARSDQHSVRLLAWTAVPLMVLTVVAGWVLLAHYALQIQGPPDGWSRLKATLELLVLLSTDTLWPLTAQATAVFLVISFTGGVMWIYVLVLALRPVLLRKPPHAADVARARTIIDRYADEPLQEFAFADDKQYFFDHTGRCVITFALWRNVALTLCDPVGPREAIREAIHEFVMHCREQDWIPVFYQASPRFLDDFREQGFTTFKIGEGARLPLAEFSLKGRVFQNLRTACNRAAREGVTFRWYPSGAGWSAAIEDELAAVSDDWLARKHGHEMAFDVGSFNIEEIRRHGVAIAMRGQRIEAFATWMPYRQGRGRCLDLMRNRPEVPGVMDFAIVESLLSFQSQGLEEACLANAPLANADASSGDDTHARVVRLIYERFDRWYGYHSLFEFKKKYLPKWQGCYLAYQSPAELPLIAAAVVRVHTPQGFWQWLRS